MDTEVNIDEVCWKFKNERVFEQEPAIALLLINEVIFVNNHWWENNWNDKQKDLFSLNVNCNDVFMWGCSDAEEMLHDDLETLWAYWMKDPIWGSAIWCIKKRNMLPQKPVYDDIMAKGIWNLDTLKLDDNFGWSTKPKSKITKLKNFIMGRK